MTSLENRTADNVQGKTHAFHSSLSGVRNRFGCAHSSRFDTREREDARRKSLSLLSSLESNLSAEMAIERKERYREKLSRLHLFDEHRLERTLFVARWFFFFFCCKEKEGRMKDVHSSSTGEVRSLEKGGACWMDERMLDFLDRDPPIVLKFFPRCCS